MIGTTDGIGCFLNTRQKAIEGAGKRHETSLQCLSE